MAWPGFDMFQPSPPVLVNDRVGRRGRGQHLYYTDGSGMLIPQAGPAVGRSNSVSGGRPAQIVINNTQYDDFSPPRTSRSRQRSRVRSPAYDDDDWDDRAHSPHRHRDRSRDWSRDRSRDRSRRRSRSHSRNRSRERSQERHRRHPHSHHHESSSPSPPQMDLETQKKLQEYEEFKRKEKEEAARERLRQEALLAQVKEAEKKQKEEEFRQRILADAERDRYEEEMKEKKKKEEEDRIFKARFREFHLAKGYSEESIEAMFNEEKKKKKKKKEHKDHSPHSPHSGDDQQVAVVKVKEMNVVNLASPTHIKVHRKYLSPETLDAYGLPWEWYDQDSNYIVIKQWINQTDQDKLFEHTRKLRERREPKLLTAAPVELKKDANGKMKLVRERSPLGVRSRSRPRSWMFT